MVLDFDVSSSKTRDKLMTLLDNLPIRYAVSVTYWYSGKIGSFKEQFRIEAQDGSSFWLGCILNSRKPINRVRLDFNPNKVGQHTAFQDVLTFLIQRTRPAHRIIKRYDLAVDIPIARNDVFLVKDNRVYLERRHGQEWTQYLGAQASHVGRVKLYNKQIEARLDYPLTRLEMTLDPATPFEKIKFPTVYYIQTMQISMEEQKITNTERFIVGALLQGYGAVTDLGRKTREKITHLLERYVKKVEISQSDYENILKQVRGYTTGQALIEPTDKDQAPRKAPETPAWVEEAEQAERTELV